MKYFFRRRIPKAGDILLMESGSPEVARRALEGIRNLFPGASFHLCTFRPDPPLPIYSSVFRVTDYPTGWKKLGLLFSFRRQGWEVLVILCTGEQILWRWKMLAMALLPAKVLVVNEHADFFWLEWDNLRTVRQLLGIRWGVNLEEFFYNLLRALIFPLTFLFLISTAGFLYLRRAWRLLQWKIQGPPPRQTRPGLPWTGRT
jgi:hypothetical protein